MRRGRREKAEGVFIGRRRRRRRREARSASELIQAT